MSLLLAMLPSALHVGVRRLLGARIEAGARIRFGSILKADAIDIGRNARIGPFSFICAKTFRTGADSEIRPLTMLKAAHLEVGDYSHIGTGVIVNSELTKRSRFSIGRHSLINPFCFIEAGEGVIIGSQTGIGGRSMIFTHAVWADYLRGGMVAYGPVRIEDEVWIAWGATILANVVVGKNAMVAAGTVVNKMVPPSSLAVGIPARIIPKGFGRPLNDEERALRARRILADYAEDGLPANEQPPPRLVHERLEFSSVISLDAENQLNSGDVLFMVNKQLSDLEKKALLARGISILDHRNRNIILATTKPYVKDFINFLNRYGIRLDIVDG
jgi:acetyltransferase-like isoleucine patch superfamily enzyme